MGQNFLIDRNLARKLVELSGVGSGDPVFEAGPGMGMISREILKTGAVLQAVEKDRRLLAFLIDHLVPEFEDRFSVIEGDAVELPLGMGRNVSELSVIANPPFAITGPWIGGMLDLGFPKTLALLLQREAVDRLIAKAGSKQFGLLSIRLEAAYEVTSLHPVPNTSFFPEPKIQSQIVVFRRREDPVAFSDSMKGIVSQLFQQRRKQIGGRLKQWIDADTFEKWESIFHQSNLSMQSRPEQVPTKVWTQLSRI